MSYLTDRIDVLFEYIKKNTNYLEHNAEAFDIYSGNLKPYVEKIMKESLSENYFNQIKSRIMPINILKRLIDKTSKVYCSPPIRKSNLQEFIDYYSQELDIDNSMNAADEFSNMFKSYALEPYIHENKPCLRVLPSDRFLVYSDDPVDPLRVTVFIKIMGNRLVYNSKTGKNEVRNVYYFYTDEEFLALDSKKELYKSVMIDNQGLNPYGVIPFFYGNRSKYELLPIQDTDLISMVKLFPVILSDLGGAILFQCFSIIYGIDLDFENLTISPNSLWSFKSDRISQKDPQIGTIKPEADIDKVMSFVKETLAIWIESRGIKAGSIANMDAQNLASGIAKIIDEMDTYELRMTAMQWFKKEEYSFWKLMQVMHNKWIEFGLLKNQGLYTGELTFSIEFDEPKPYMSKTEQLDLLEREYKLGTIDFEYMVKELHPDWEQEQVDEIIEKKNKESEPVVIKENTNGLDENGDKDTEDLQSETEGSDSSGSY